MTLNIFPALQSYYLGMSLQNMNQMRLVPKKDYVANRLVSGVLQLARNTSLFLDETQLEQGQLDTTGEASRNHKGTTLRGQTLQLMLSRQPVDTASMI